MVVSPTESAARREAAATAPPQRSPSPQGVGSIEIQLGGEDGQKTQAAHRPKMPPQDDAASGAAPPGQIATPERAAKNPPAAQRAPAAGSELVVAEEAINPILPFTGEISYLCCTGPRKIPL